VLGEFPTAEDETVIPLELVVSAVGRTVSSLDYYPVWGVDVATTEQLSPSDRPTS
jgi:hypothetical protein